MVPCLVLSVTLRHLPMRLDLLRLALVDHCQFVARLTLCSVRGEAEAKVHSAAKPDFYRIYQIEQAADVARSTSTGVDRVTKFSFEALGPKLAPLFEGSQELVSITSVPFYSRSIYVPRM